MESDSADELSRSEEESDSADEFEESGELACFYFFRLLVDL
jgi:hypothetical protein